MAKSITVMKNEKKNEYLEKISNFLKSLDEDVVRTASGEIAFPTVLENGDDSFITVKIAIPSGTRGSDGYDGYAEAKSYRIECEKNAAKAENAKKAKDAKIAKDKARRENSAKIRAEKEKRKGN